MAVDNRLQLVHVRVPGVLEMVSEVASSVVAVAPVVATVVEVLVEGTAGVLVELALPEEQLV